MLIILINLYSIKSCPDFKSTYEYTYYILRLYVNHPKIKSVDSFP